MYFYYSQPIRRLLILKQSILSNKDYSHGNICSFESCQYMHNYTVLAILPMLNKMLYCHIPWSLWMWIIPTLVGPAKKYNHIVSKYITVWRFGGCAHETWWFVQKLAFVTYEFLNFNIETIWNHFLKILTSNACERCSPFRCVTSKLLMQDVSCISRKLLLKGIQKESAVGLSLGCNSSCRKNKITSWILVWYQKEYIKWYIKAFCLIVSHINQLNYST